MKNIFLISLCLLGSIFTTAFAQNDNNRVNFSGVIVDGDSLVSLPYTHVIVKSNNTGTVADYYGFFSILAHKGDTILFSRVGYLSNQFIIPDTLPGNEYSVIHTMLKETVSLEEVEVHPWPSYDEFKASFMSYSEDEYLSSAQSNLATEKLKELSAKVNIEGNTTYKNEVKNRHTMMYQTHGYPSYSIFNPFAWQKFIKAWRNGELKNKKNNTYLPK